MAGGPDAASEALPVSGRVAELIAALSLRPHQEGGYYSEVHRSGSIVFPADGRGSRPALTAIYFLLPDGSVSRWHRVQSDEVWHFYEGAALDLWTATPAGDQVDRHTLGPLQESHQPVLTVPAGCWQAARSTGPYTLAGCTVGPGFDFADFTMASGHPGLADALRSRAPVLLL
jgi:uncharacterized protein